MGWGMGRGMGVLRRESQLPSIHRGREGGEERKRETRKTDRLLFRFGLGLGLVLVGVLEEED